MTAIKEISQTIGQISRIAGNIATAIEQQTSATQEIAKNVQSAASGTHEIAESISEVNRGASETGAASGEVLNSAQTLAVESTRLRQESIASRRKTARVAVQRRLGAARFRRHPALVRARPACPRSCRAGLRSPRAPSH